MMTLSDIQKRALDRSRIASFPDEATRPDFDAFVQSIIDAKADEHVALWDDRDRIARIEAIERGLRVLPQRRIEELQIELAAAVEASMPAASVSEPEGGV